MREIETGRQTNRQTEIHSESEKFTEKDGPWGDRDKQTDK